MLLLFILSPSTSILLPNAVTQPLLTPTITPLRTPPPPQCTTIGPAESNRKPVLPENGPYLFMIGVLCLMPFTPLPIDVPNSMLLTRQITLSNRAWAATASMLDHCLRRQYSVDLRISVGELRAFAWAQGRVWRGADL